MSFCIEMYLLDYILFYLCNTSPNAHWSEEMQGKVLYTVKNYNWWNIQTKVYNKSNKITKNFDKTLKVCPS